MLIAVAEAMRVIYKITMVTTMATMNLMLLIRT